MTAAFDLGAPLRLQPSSYSCGPAALKNAITVLGYSADVRRLARLAGTTRMGTDEHGLARAAQASGFELRHITTHTPAFTIETLRGYHRLGCPSLVTVDRWTHWVAIIRCNSRHAWVADSSRPGPVLQRNTWRLLLSRMAVWFGPGDVRWDIYPLVPT